jgi:ribosomal protein S18 acetylase RimI-like enzyme
VQGCARKRFECEVDVRERRRVGHEGIVRCRPEARTLLGVTVRRGRPEDRTASVRTAVRAFASDPFIRHLLPDDDAYEAQGSAFFGSLFDVRLAGGEVWCTDDCVAVAQWTPPGGNRRGGAWVEAQLDAVADQVHPLTYERMEQLEALLSPTWPTEAHWYLGVLATHPDWQQRGLASALLAAVLSDADMNAREAYLVTATSENVAFYRRHGFDVHVEADLPDGPHIWMLVRPPLA